MRHHIVVLKGGGIRMIYTDALPLSNLGKLTISRASNVEYDNDRGGWVTTLVTGEELPGIHPTRQAALVAEIEEVNRRLALWPA
jgi:hypothetical protein